MVFDALKLSVLTEEYRFSRGCPSVSVQTSISHYVSDKVINFRSNNTCEISHLNVQLF